MSKPVRLSYLVMTLLLVLVGWLHLATLLLPGLLSANFKAAAIDPASQGAPTESTN